MTKYYILVRKVKYNGENGDIEADNNFQAIPRTDSPYIGYPKAFDEKEMLEEYTLLSVKYGSDNVRVAEVKYMKLEGRARFIDDNESTPWAHEGKIDIIE